MSLLLFCLYESVYIKLVQSFANPVGEILRLLVVYTAIIIIIVVVGYCVCLTRLRVQRERYYAWERPPFSECTYPPTCFSADFDAIFSTARNSASFRKSGGGGRAEMREDDDEYYTLLPICVYTIYIVTDKQCTYLYNGYTHVIYYYGTRFDCARYIYIYTHIPECSENGFPAQ